MKWEDCPMYDKSNKNSTDIDVLHEGHRNIVKQLKRMNKDAKGTSKYIKMHMEEEGEHHRAVNSTLSAVANAMKEVSADNKTLMEDKKNRDTIKDKRESFKEKIYGTLAVAILIGAYNLFMDIMHMKQALTGD